MKLWDILLVTSEAVLNPATDVMKKALQKKWFNTIVRKGDRKFSA